MTSVMGRRRAPGLRLGHEMADALGWCPAAGAGELRPHARGGRRPGVAHAPDPAADLRRPPALGPAVADRLWGAGGGLCGGRARPTPGPDAAPDRALPARGLRRPVPGLA